MSPSRIVSQLQMNLQHVFSAGQRAKGLSPIDGLVDHDPVGLLVRSADGHVAPGDIDRAIEAHCNISGERKRAAPAEC